jgi:hypothetical protein
MQGQTEEQIVETISHVLGAMQTNAIWDLDWMTSNAVQ